MDWKVGLYRGCYVIKGFKEPEQNYHNMDLTRKMFSVYW